MCQEINLSLFFASLVKTGCTITIIINLYLFCFVFGLHYLYVTAFHEDRLHLGNKNDKSFCISLDLHYLCNHGRNF